MHNYLAEFSIPSHKFPDQADLSFIKQKAKRAIANYFHPIFYLLVFYVLTVPLIRFVVKSNVSSV